MKKIALVSVFFILVMVCCNAAKANDNCSGDDECFYLGLAEAFAGMVYLDVKSMAITEPLNTEALNAMEPKIRELAARRKVKYYRDESMLVTDLFPARKTAGLGVFLLYLHDEVLEIYKKLKLEKSELIKTGQYNESERARINYAFGELLGYPNTATGNLIASNKDKE